VVGADSQSQSPVAGVSAEGQPVQGQGLSFQNRIAVVALVTAVAVLMGACGLFMLEQWRTERTHFIQSQANLARMVAIEAAEPMSRGDLKQITAIAEALKADGHMTAAVIVDERGRTLVNLRQPRLARADEAKVQAPILVDGQRRGEVELTFAPDPLAALLPRFISIGGSLFFVAAGLALFMGRWLAGRLTRPVDKLSRTMHEVAGSGDFTRRVRHGENDEFGRLTDSFNALLAQLDKNDRALRATMDELVEARDAAEAANVLKSHFLANMSHEIRTPLNGVLAMGQIMAMGELDETQRERLAVIRQSGEALLAVLNDILDLSKIEAGRMEIEAVEFDTAELARQLEAVHGPIATKKGLQFEVALDESAQGVRRGDPARVQQILNNLLANAAKFTPAGRIAIAFHGEGEDGASGLKIAVSDTGIGVAADKLPLLFQKFSQVDSSTTRQFGGTGLGLAICRELAQLMGGTVWAESVEGKGSTFYVSLPLERVSAASAAETEASEAPAGDIASLKILAAEDNATNQLVLRTVLATFGLEVDVAADGRQAVEAWSKGGYDLILMDIQMPVMDGVAATRAIRSAEAADGKPRIPIIALSANAMTHQVKEYLAAGMDMHVAKPIQLAKLQEALEMALSAQAEQRAGQAA
jgi:signal transduction histidine kinase/AmiR/NasT family two-component response regulator